METGFDGYIAVIKLQNGYTILAGMTSFKFFQEALHDGKRFEIYTAGLKFELGRASLIRVWDNRGFTRSSRPTKCAFKEVRFPRIQKYKFQVIYSVIFNF